MKLIIAAHGQMAQEVVNSANMVFGGIENAEAVTFVPGENADDLKQKLPELYDRGRRCTVFGGFVQEEAPIMRHFRSQHRLKTQM